MTKASKVFTILIDGYADWECAFTVSAARTYYGLETFVVTIDGKPVTSAGGLHVTPDMSIADIDATQGDVILINGGSVWESDDAPDISALLIDAKANGVTIGAICAATRALAQAGLLNDIKHTGNAKEQLQAMSGYSGTDNYVDVPGAVSDQSIITAAGTAPVSFMKEVMETLGKGGDELNFYVGMFAAEHTAA